MPFGKSARRQCLPYAAVLRAFVDLPGITRDDATDTTNNDNNNNNNNQDGANAAGNATSRGSGRGNGDGAAYVRSVGGGQVFSLHNMVRCGMAAHDKLPGEWYGPAA